MAQQSQNSKPADKLLQRPLYIFDLPEELLYTLQLQQQPNVFRGPTQGQEPARRSSPAPNEGESQANGSKAAISCGLCGLTFASLQEQRSHVRSDLHGYNLKQKMRGQKPVDEGEFERLVGQLDESLSGSDTTDSEDDGEDELGSGKKESTLSALLKRQARVTDGDAEDAPAKRQRGSGEPPIFWFTSSKLAADTRLGIYRAIFTSAEQRGEDHLVETIQRKQLSLKPQPHQQNTTLEDGGAVSLPASMMPKNTSANGPHYFLCMIGGGHFAAMLVSLMPKLVKKAGVEDRSATVIAHKTFHRYTTRRKQGGSQSANDQSKGNAQSAGSSLRRYNEVALTQEVRELLAHWRGWIETAELLFIRATGSTNRDTLFGAYEGNLLSQKDPRVRGFPFSTRRATQSELMRAFFELTRVKLTTVDKAALAEKAEENAAAMARAEATNGKLSTPKPSKPSREDEEAALHTSQIQTLIRRSKAHGVLSYLQSNSLSPDFRFFPAGQHHHSPTPLHLAAASNSSACVSALLTKIGADPELRNGDGKSAFDIAGDRATRDAFRLARSQLGESRWKWDEAGVPAALSQAEANKRVAREQEERDVEEASEKQRRQMELERLKQEDKDKMDAGKEKKFGKGHVMAQPKLTAEERRMEEARGMSDETRRRFEREKRARAAEERMKRLKGK